MHLSGPVVPQSRAGAPVVLFAAVVLWALAGPGLKGVGAADQAPADPAQVKQWIEDLAAKEFEKRGVAKEQLRKAGPAVRAALEGAREHQSLEVREAVVELLAPYQWEALKGPGDSYLGHLSDEAILLAYFKDLDGFSAGAGKTALAQFWQSPALQPLREVFEKELAKEEGSKFFEVLRRLKPRQGVAVVEEINFFIPIMNKIALAVELGGEDPQEASLLLRQAPLFAGFQEEQTQGLTLYAAKDGSGGFALAGRHLILGINKGSVLSLAQALLKAPAKNLQAGKGFTDLRAGLGAEPNALILLNLPAFTKKIWPMALMALSMAVPDRPELLQMKPDENLHWVGWSLGCLGDRFEEQFLVMTQKVATEQFPHLKDFLNQKERLAKVLGQAPADADLLVALGKQLPPSPPQAVDPAAFDKAVQQLASKDIQLPNLIAYLKKGALFQLFSSQGAADPLWWGRSSIKGGSEFGVNVGCADAEMAQGLCKALEEALAAGGKDLLANLKRKGHPQAAQLEQYAGPFVKSVAEGGVTLFTEAFSLLDLPEIQELKPLHGISWAAQDSQFVMGSSPEKLKARLAQLKGGAPGYQPSPAVTRDIQEAALPFLLVAHTANIFEQAAHVLGKQLAAERQDTPFAKALAQVLAGSPGLFANLPPTTLTLAMPAPNLITGRFRSVLPVGGWLALMAVLARDQIEKASTMVDGPGMVPGGADGGTGEEKK